MPAPPKVVYPSNPGTPAAPTLTDDAGGALAAATYYAKTTYTTANGETLPSAESNRAVAVNRLLHVASPIQLASPYFASGYNVYVSKDPGGSGAETKQNASAIAIGTDWVEPTSGLIAGAAPPSSWGTTFNLARFVRQIPYSDKSAARADLVTVAGQQQSIFFREDFYLDVDGEWIGLSNNDAAGWSAFLDSALTGQPFDWYPDRSVGSFTTYIMLPEKKEHVLAYKVVDQYTLHFRARKVIP